MNPDPDEGLLSDWEREILHELEWEIETTDPDLAAVFHLLEQHGPAIAGVMPSAVGAMVALTAFSLTVVVTLAGLATMGMGLGLALFPTVPMPHSRQR